MLVLFFSQWTPDPPPKKKKSKKQGKKSLLTGFGPGSAADEKSEDVRFSVYVRSKKKQHFTELHLRGY